jgi:GNAT superfamily N-acetyltransferase
MLSIERAAASDVEELLPLVSQYWGFERIEHFDSELVASQLARLLNHSDLGAGWVARSDEGLVGYILLVWVFSLEHLGLTAEIDEFFVLSQHRQAGCGAALLAAAETEAKARGCTNIALQLAKSNQRSRDFYSAHGYRARSTYEILDKTT